MLCFEVSGGERNQIRGSKRSLSGFEDELFFAAWELVNFLACLCKLSREVSTSYLNESEPIFFYQSLKIVFLLLS